MKLTGKCSVFGGPKDMGVKPSEGLALLNVHDLNDRHFANLFLPKQPEGTTGLARRLNPKSLYCAMRWSYTPAMMRNRRNVQLLTPPAQLRHAVVKASANGRVVEVQPVDWGPNENTGRIIDFSPGAADYLGLSTDEIVTVELVFA